MNETAPTLRLRDVEGEINRITGIVIDVAIAVHRMLGPGLLENVYSVAMVHLLRKRGLRVQTEVAVPLTLDGDVVTTGFRIDLLVEGTVIVELKAVERVLDVHRSQVLTYLKLSGHPVGLLINFNEALVTKGIYRYVRTTTGGNAEGAESAEKD